MLFHFGRLIRSVWEKHEHDRTQQSLPMQILIGIFAIVAGIGFVLFGLYCILDEVLNCFNWNV